jgi:hypothetical protein
VFITQGELARNHQQMCVGSRCLPPHTAWRRPRQSISGELRGRLLHQHRFRLLGKLVVGNLDRIADVDDLGN